MTVGISIAAACAGLVLLLCCVGVVAGVVVVVVVRKKSSDLEKLAAPPSFEMKVVVEGTVVPVVSATHSAEVPLSQQVILGVNPLAGDECEEGI